MKGVHAKLQCEPNLHIHYNDFQLYVSDISNYPHMQAEPMASAIWRFSCGYSTLSSFILILLFYDSCQISFVRFHFPLLYEHIPVCALWVLGILIAFQRSSSPAPLPWVVSSSAPCTSGTPVSSALSIKGAILYRWWFRTPKTVNYGDRHTNWWKIKKWLS